MTQESKEEIRFWAFALAFIAFVMFISYQLLKWSV
jgi:uncharacterized membrane protein